MELLIKIPQGLLKKFSPENLKILKKKRDELIPKIFTKNEKKRKKINEKDEQAWDELVNINNEFIEFCKLQKRNKEIELRNKARKELAKYNLQEGDYVSTNHWNMEVKGNIIIDRSGKIMVDKVVVYDDNLYVPYNFLDEIKKIKEN